MTLVGCSEAAAENLADIANVPLDDIVVIPSLVDVDRVVALAHAVPAAAADDSSSH